MKALIEELRVARSEIQRLQGMEERIEQLELANKLSYSRR
jgi:hypothetical protein